jgi:peptidoglycan/xylan/chitin deacetylase (PgdA/CDA1 family)
MFLKRSLVLIVGVLLFIAVFLFKIHHSDAKIENEFQQARVQYGVEQTILTAPEAPSTPLALPAPTVTPASTAPPPTPPPAPEPTTPPAPTADNSTAAPGSTADTNVIIGPVPPSPDATAPQTPPMAPTPDTNSTPSIDTNNGPMAPPPPTTMVEPRNGSPFLVMAAYDPAGTVLHMAGEETAQSTMPAPVTNVAPATTPTNVPVAATTKSETTTTNPAPSITSAGPSAGRPIPVEASIIILGYHQFTGPGVPSKNIYSMSQDVFESEMKYLHDNGYHVVPLSDVVRFVKHEIGLPPNTVAITIDDGYKSALNYAWPVLKKYNYPWTYFVYPEFITRTEGKGAASWPDLVELDKEGVDVESHSMTHPQLSRHRQMFTEVPSANGGPPTIKYGRTYHQLTDQEYADFLTNETAGAKAILEKELNKPIKYLAYPYGDYNKTVEAAAIAAGYEAIFTVADNPVHTTTNIYSIGRYIITKPVERAFASYLRQGALGLAAADPAPGATITDPRPVITAVLDFTGNLDPKSIETDVRDYGVVRHDFDPKTSTLRLYLPRDLIQSQVLVSIHVRDAQSGQMMVANWHFNYEAAPAVPAVHQPISSGPATNASSASAVKQAPAAASAPVISAAPNKGPGTNP